MSVGRTSLYEKDVTVMKKFMYNETYFFLRNTYTHYFVMFLCAFSLSCLLYLMTFECKLFIKVDLELLKAIQNGKIRGEMKKEFFTNVVL